MISSLRLPAIAALRLLLGSARSILATAAFCSIARGCYLAWEPLGWIVPGALVFAALAWTHLRGGPPANA